jgi:gamma-glutamylcyclotransferase (GGCT)/AIG2-like uncharacterized protein YtfP
MPLPLFVYGTLRRGHDNEYARLLAEASDFVCTGRVRGTLYRIAHYPGCVEDGLPDRWVAGEIWRPDSDETADRLLKSLDAYEGREYTRASRIVETAGGPVECWIYLYTDPVAGKTEIESGDWLAG